MSAADIKTTLDTAAWTTEDVAWIVFWGSIFGAVVYVDWALASAVKACNGIFPVLINSFFCILKMIFSWVQNDNGAKAFGDCVMCDDSSIIS